MSRRRRRLRQEPRPAETVDGQELVAQAAQRLLRAPGIEAKTRQRVSIFDQQLVGSGTYLQLHSGPGRLMLRLDLKLQVGERVTSLLQISDGESYWVRRDEPDQTSLSRVNVRRLREAATEVSEKRPDVPVPPSLWMALGGLPRLLSTLEGHFQFAAPQPIAVGRLPVWRVEGTWKPEILANLLPDQKQAILAGEPADLDKLPDHLPHGVTLILGRDQVIPLFPYSISYFRLAPEDPRAPGPRRHEPMVTWELFEVRIRPDLAPTHFDYRPGDQEVDERTDEFISRLYDAMGKPKGETPGRK